MGANPNIFQNKENRRVVPPGDENFFVTAEEFQAIDTAFASKADQSEVDSIDGRLTTAEGDIDGLQTQVGIIEGNLTIAEGNIGDLLGDVSTIEGDISALQSGKEDVSNKATDFTTVNNTLYPTVQAVDTEIDTEIDAQVAEPNSNQFDVTGGVATIKSVFTQSTAFTISFATSTEHGSPQDPVYALLDLTITNARHLNTCTVKHCGLVAPLLFDDVWAAPSASYETTVAMIAAQGSQTSGLVYRVGTSYWKFTGTLTASIDDYIQVRIVYSGDAYLTGTNNLNFLTFEYREFHEIGTDVIKDCVLVSNIAITGGNEDTTKPVMELLVNFQFNHNRDVTVNDDVDNSSFWGQNGQLLGNVVPASGASYIDLGGGNFSLRTNTTNNAVTGGTPSIQLPSQLFNRIMGLGKFTFITRVRRVSPSSANFVYLAKFMNDAQTDGFRCAWELNSGLDNRLWVRINGSNFRSNVGSLPFNQPEWLMTAWTYSDADDRLRHYVEAPTYTPAIPFQLLHTNTVTGSRPITSTSDVFVLNRETTAGQRNNVEYDYVILVADELPQSVIESIKNAPTDVESILRTHYGY